MGKKSISRKMLLPVFLASFCSGANAMENKNVAPAQKISQNGKNAITNNLPVKTKDDSKQGFSGLAMAGANAVSAMGGGFVGYLLGSKMNAPKPGPTQQEYDAIVSERNQLRAQLTSKSEPTKEEYDKVVAEREQLKTQLNSRPTMEEYEKVKKESTEFKSNYESLKKTLNELSGGKDNAKVINDLQSEVGTLKASLLSSQQEVGTLKASLLSSQQEVGTLKASLSSSQQLVDEKNNIISDLNKDLEKTKNELSSLKSNKDHDIDPKIPEDKMLLSEADVKDTMGVREAAIDNVAKCLGKNDESMPKVKLDNFSVDDWKMLLRLIAMTQSCWLGKSKSEYGDVYYKEEKYTDLSSLKSKLIGEDGDLDLFLEDLFSALQSLRLSRAP